MSSPRRRRLLSRAESKDLTRRKLLDAARRVFLRQGFHATTVDMVAREAGFTKGAVYATFASKADLFLALYAERTEERAAQAAAIAATAGADADREALKAWADVLRHERAWLLVLLEFWIFAARDAALRRRFAAINTRLRTSLAEATERSARAAGRVLPADPELLVLCQVALGNGIALESFRDPTLAASDVFERAARALARGMETLREEPRERRREAAR
jgi:AcrR family transcriptional regulator